MAPTRPEVKIALIDDDESVLNYLGEFFSGQGMGIYTFNSAEQALRALPMSQSRNGPFDLVLADVNLPGISGIDLLKELKRQFPSLILILISAQIDVKDAVIGIKEGAYGLHPEEAADLDRLSVIIRNALQLRAAQRSSESDSLPIKSSGVICPSPAMRVIYDLIRRAAPTDSSVLVYGESGVGKELVARAIHDNSSRAKYPFVSINCSAIPENLLESELFGHAKGSFTGAHQERSGLFAEANGGTLFLDEIGDLNPLLQVKLLRAIQEKKVRPVGANRYQDVDVRIVSATNKNLSQAVKEGKFREDLYYRLNVIPIHVAPLRQRREDIVVLAEHFLEVVCGKMGLDSKHFSSQAMEKLLKMDFRGNVRELQNTIERSVIFSDGSIVEPTHIPSPLETETPPIISGLSNDLPPLEELESLYIKSILERYQDKQVAADILGVSRRTLYRRIEEIEKRDKTRSAIAG